MACVRVEWSGEERRGEEEWGEVDVREVRGWRGEGEGGGGVGERERKRKRKREGGGRQHKTLECFVNIVLDTR